MVKKVILLTMLSFISMFVMAQTDISGIVKDEDGKVLDAVKVRLKGAIEYKTVTDESGKFALKIPEKSTKILEFSKEGFDTREVSVDGKPNVIVELLHGERINQYGVKVERDEGATEFQNGILVLEAKNGKFKFWFDSRVYIDGAYFMDDNAYNKIGNGITIRRARFAVKAKLWDNWYGELDLDFAGAKMELKDAYMKYTTDNGKTNFKIGNFKEGFSMESTTTSRYLTFIERSLVNEFAPSRHLGLNSTTWGTNYTLIGGLHFQKVGELEEVEFTKDKNKDFGIDEGYSLTARLVGRPISTKEFTIHVGVNGSYRTPKTSWEYIDQYRVSTRSLSSVNRKKYLDTDDIMGVKSRAIYGVEFATFYKNIMFQSEYMLHDIFRTEDYETVNNDGFYAQVGVLLFGGKYQYNRAEAEPTQVTRGRNWGDIEVAFRFDHLNLNDAEANVYGGAADGYTFGINYHVNHNIKFMLNYTYLNHDRYANGKGKLYVGHDADGNLTSDFTEVVEESGKAGDDFGMIQVRFEVDF